jgi:hypothetical protein
MLSSAIVPLLSLACVFSVLGGYVCARVARRNERRVTVVLAVLMVIGLSMTAGASAVLVQALTFASVMAGGLFGRYRNVVERRTPAAAMVA